MSIERVSGLEVLRYAAEEATPGDLNTIQLKTRVTQIENSSIAFEGLGTVGRVLKVDLVDSEWRPLPATPLTGRQTILVQNNAGFYNVDDKGNSILLNYSDTAANDEGVLIDDTLFKERTIKPTVILYGRVIQGTTSGSATVSVEELA